MTLLRSISSLGIFMKVIIFMVSKNKVNRPSVKAYLTFLSQVTNSKKKKYVLVVDSLSIALEQFYGLPLESWKMHSTLNIRSKPSINCSIMIV